MVGPFQFTSPVCLGCNKLASLRGPRCSGFPFLEWCHFPFTKYTKAVIQFLFWISGAPAVYGRCVRMNVQSVQFTEQSARYCKRMSPLKLIPEQTSVQVLSAAGLCPKPLNKHQKDRGAEDEDDHPIYESLAALWVCLLQLERRENWDLGEVLETHREARKKTESWKYLQHNVVNYLMRV